MISSHRPDPDSIVLTVDVRRIDASISMAFKERARQIIADQNGRIIIDLSAVEFIDSSGLGTLVAIMKMLDDGRRLELANCGPAVAKVLALTRMDQVFVLHDAPPVSSRRGGEDAPGGTNSQDAA